MSERVEKRAWVPPGVDPKQYTYPMKSKSGCMSRLFQLSIIGFAIYGFISLAQASSGQPAAALPPTAAPTATLTPYLSPTPESAGFVVYEIGVERSPTATAWPTATSIPPGALATWTPGPWLAERWLATYEALYATATPE